MMTPAAVSIEAAEDMVRAVDLIRRKRHGGELTPGEIAFLVSGFTNGTIPDYQVAAFLMAVNLVGMTEQETLALTQEMLHSGSVLDLSDLPGKKIDKHSTGGVGDKTSLIVAPLAAAAGITVPMITGRGLAHSGGTLDKLESVPGFDVALDLARFRRVLEKAGCAFIGQTAEIAPADRKLYALRDVTGTVESVPLITGSILSKKLAEGIDGLVLDVKAGTGAFMKDEGAATELGNLLVAIARRMGKRAVALLTDMDQPLGTHIGNALEVKESIEVLAGGGPEDLRELSLTLTAHMLVLGEAVRGLGEGREKAARLMATGAGVEKLIEVVKLQDGDSRVVEDSSRLAAARHHKDVLSPGEGFVAAMDTEALGMAGMLLGAGRERVEDTIDPAVGLVVHKKIGAAVAGGEPLVTLHFNGSSRLEEVERLVADAYRLETTRPASRPLVRAVLGVEDGRSSSVS